MHEKNIFDRLIVENTQGQFLRDYFSHKIVIYVSHSRYHERNLCEKHLCMQNRPRVRENVKIYIFSQHFETKVFFFLYLLENIWRQLKHFFVVLSSSILYEKIVSFMYLIRSHTSCFSMPSSVWYEII